MDVTAKDFLNPNENCMDDLTAQFELYKAACQLRHDQLKFDSSDLIEKIKNMRRDVKDLQQAIDNVGEKPMVDRKSELINDLNTIESAHSLAYNVDKEKTTQMKSQETAMFKSIIITCETSVCLFQRCQQSLNGQVMLLHYLEHHSIGMEGLNKLHEIYEGENVVLSFNLKSCNFRKNHVLGVLVYGGLLDQKFAKISQKVVYNANLPKAQAHLAGHVPIVVLICKTSASAAIKDKSLARKVQARSKISDQVYVIWLVTPIKTLDLNGTLYLCGRDAAAYAGTILAVRQITDTQNPSKFMPVDGNHWRLTHNEISKISNDFKDELNLDIRICEVRKRLQN